MSETLGLSEAANAKFLVSSLVPEIFGLTILPLFQCYRDNASLMRLIVWGVAMKSNWNQDARNTSEK